MENNDPKPTGQEPEAPGQDPNAEGQEPTNGNADGQDPNSNAEWMKEELARVRAEAAKERVKRRELEEAQAARERQEAEKRGEYERLYNETKAEYETAKSELEALRTFKAKADEQEEERRKALLTKLPDDLREVFADADARKIQAVLERISAAGSSPAGNRQPPKPGTKAPETPPAPTVGQDGWLSAQLSSQS